MKQRFFIVFLLLLLGLTLVWLQKLLAFNQWGAPLYLGFTLAIPIMIWLMIHHHRQTQKQLAEYIAYFLQTRLEIQPRHQVMFLRSSLWILICLCFSLALARPQGDAILAESENSGIDILIAIDVSDSSRATDVYPNRLEGTKTVIRHIFRALASDRMGLMVFTDEAFPVAPLTNDYDALDTLLDEVDPSLLASGGTHIPAVLELAAQRFKNTEEDVGKLLLIFSDGENHEGDLTSAIAPLKNQGVRIFTIGVGTKQGARIPEQSETWGTMSYKQYNGQDVVTRLDEAALKQIASQGQGEYFRLDNFEDLIQAIQTARTQLKHRNYKSTQALAFEEKYPYYLWLALFLILLERSVFLWENKWQNRLNQIMIWFKQLKNRPRRFQQVLSRVLSKQSTQTFIGALFATGLYTLLQGAWAWPWSPYLAHRQGQSAYTEKQFDQSIDAYNQGLEAAPHQPELHYNKGNALYQKEDWAKAAQAYQDTLAQDNLSPEQQAQTLYNLGNTFYRQGQNNGNPKEDWAKALEAYQKSLELKPDDREAQENLEFVKKQLENLQNQSGNSQNNQENSQNQNQENQSQNPGQNQSQNQGQNQQNQGQSSEGQENKYSEQEVKNFLESMEQDERNHRNRNYFRRHLERRQPQDLFEMKPEDLMSMTPEELRKLMENSNEDGTARGYKNW